MLCSANHQYSRGEDEPRGFDRGGYGDRYGDRGDRGERSSFDRDRFGSGGDRFGSGGGGGDRFGGDRDRYSGGDRGGDRDRYSGDRDRYGSDRPSERPRLVLDKYVVLELILNSLHASDANEGYITQATLPTRAQRRLPISWR